MRRGRTRHIVASMMRFVWILAAICVGLLLISFIWAALKFLLIIALIGIVAAGCFGLYSRISGGSRRRSDW